MKVPHSRPWITDADLEAVQGVLRSDMIGQCARTAAFEAALSAWVGGTSGIATGSGSAALTLALLALGVERGDEVVLPTYVCPDVLDVVSTVAATPRLCDVGRDWVMTTEAAAPAITSRTRAIIVPHMYGIFADVAAFKVFNLPIIEDCAQALGFRGRPPLSGDVAVYSFHPTKCLTTGMGGMAVASDPTLCASMRDLRDGRTGAHRLRVFSPMSDIAAALGLSQLARYEHVLDRRLELATRYFEALGPVIPDALPWTVKSRSMFFRFPVRLTGGIDAWAGPFSERGIIVRRGVDVLLHRLKGLPDTAFPCACELFDTTVSLPLHPSLSDAEHGQCLRAAVDTLSMEA